MDAGFGADGLAGDFECGGEHAGPEVQGLIDSGWGYRPGDGTWR
jgi:hypothetical protein